MTGLPASKPIIFFPLFALVLSAFLVFGDIAYVYNTLIDVADEYHAVRPSLIGNVFVMGDENNVYYDISCVWDHVVGEEYGYNRVVSDQPSGLVYHVAGVPLVRFSIRFVNESGVSEPVVYPLFSIHHRIRDRMEFLQAVLKINPRVSATNYSTDVWLEWKHYVYDPGTGKYVLKQVDGVHRALPSDIYQYWLTVYFLPAFYSYVDNGSTVLVFGFRYSISFTSNEYIEGQMAWTSLVLAENQSLPDLVDDVRAGLEKLYGWTAWIGLGLVVYREPDLENIRDWHYVEGDSLRATVRLSNPVVYDFVVDPEKLAEKFYSGELEEYTGELEYSAPISGVDEYLVLVGVLVPVSVVPVIAVRRHRLAPIVSGLLFTAMFFVFVSPDIRVAISYVVGVLLAWRR